MAPLTITLTLAVAAGLAAGLYSPRLTSIAPLVLAAGGTFAWLGHTRGFARVALVSVGACVFAAAALWGATRLQQALHPPLRELLEARYGGFRIGDIAGPRIDEPVVIEGRLLGDAIASPAGSLLRIESERVWLGPCPEPAAAGLSITVGGSLGLEAARAWTRGRRVRMPVLLRRPGVFLNRGMPDEERALAIRGTALVGTVKSAALVEVTSLAWWWDEWAARTRARIRTTMAARIGGTDARGAGIATAILIGDRGGLDADTERRLQESGTYHVVAISGGNIAILAGLVVWLVSWLRPGERAASAVVVSVLGVYFLVTDGGASVARATLMATVYFGLRIVDLRAPAANTLALTVLILLLIDPLAVADVGLWLTVGATAAILAGAGVPGGRGVLLGLLIASACAELALTPISAWMFERITVAGLALNFVAIPCMTVVQVGAMVTLGGDMAGLDGLAGVAARVTSAAAFGLVESSRLVDAAPWLTWRVPPPSGWVIAAYYAALVAAGWLFAGGCRPSGHPKVVRFLRRAAVGAVCALWLWVAVAPPRLARVRGDGLLHVHVLDVGQGDATLVVFPNGRRLLVDAGAKSPTGTFDVGERVIGPVLRSRGISRIDALAVTHGDPDHIGGAEAVTRAFAPAEIWEGVPVSNHEATKRLRDAAAAVRAAWRTLQTGDRVEIGGVAVRVLHPPPPDWERQRVRNDDSVVLELRHGDVSILLPGDIGHDVEQLLVPSLALGSLVILKAPHHGSGTSSSEEFVAATRPALALISAGRGNSYGHPVPYVLERYERVGAEIHRTDREGEIEVVSDGTKVSVTGTKR